MKSTLIKLAFILSVFCAGCTTEYVDIDKTVPPYFHAQNVFIDPQGRAALPSRVLVLPCSGRAVHSTLQELTGLLLQELTKVNLFEVISPPASKVKNLRSDQELSFEEAKVWAQEAGADGVMICRITSCQSVRPLVLGANLKLWSFPKENTVWSVNETLDSQLTLVANGARNYYLSNFRASYPTRRSDQILESPSMFFQYAFAELFSTISPH